MSELKEKPPFIPSLTEGDFSAVTVKRPKGKVQEPFIGVRG